MCHTDKVRRVVFRGCRLTAMEQSRENDNHSLKKNCEVLLALVFYVHKNHFLTVNKVFAGFSSTKTASGEGAARRVVRLDIYFVGMSTAGLVAVWSD